MHRNRRYTGGSPMRCRHPGATIVNNSWLATQKGDVEQRTKHYWPIKHELTMIAGIAMKGGRIIIPYFLKERYWNSFTATIWVCKR